MTEKEHAVEKARLDVREAESNAREAKVAMDAGTKKSRAAVAQAKAESEEEINSLIEKLERALIKVEVERAGLKHAEAELARGYEA